MPKRIQRKRTKGWRMPEGAVYVGRPSKWGNPYNLSDYLVEDESGVMKMVDVEPDQARAMACRDFYTWIFVGRAPYDHDDIRKELRGKDLACWCPLDKECHADILLEIANG